MIKVAVLGVAQGNRSSLSDDKLAEISLISHKQLRFLLQDTSCQIGVTSLLVTLVHVWQELQKPQVSAAPGDQTVEVSSWSNGQLPLPSVNGKRKSSGRICTQAPRVSCGIGGIWHSEYDMNLSGVSEQHKHCGD